MNDDINPEWVEKAVEWFHETTLGCAHRGDIHECVLRARELLRSDWFAAVADDIRAQTLRDAADAISEQVHPDASQAVNTGYRHSASILRARAEEVGK